MTNPESTIAHTNPTRDTVLIFTIYHFLLETPPYTFLMIFEWWIGGGLGVRGFASIVKWGSSQKEGPLH